MMKRLILVTALLSACLIVQAQEQQNSEQIAPVTQMSYLPGHTQAEEIFRYWQEHQVQVIARGYLALGSGSGVDNGSKAYDKNVELIDVTGVDFEGLHTARSMFYKGVLYCVQSRLKTPYKVKKGPGFKFVGDTKSEPRLAHFSLAC